MKTITYLKSYHSLLWIVIAIFILSLLPLKNALSEFHHVNGCTSCHNFFSFSGSNLHLIYEQMQTPNSGTKNVVLTARTGPDSFADGDAVYDGVCEVCHTQTRHHRNDGSDNTAHFDGEDCIICHTHGNEFSALYSKSHDIHLTASRERSMDCVDCHEDAYQQQTILFTDGELLDNTGVCDDCHSPNGANDGVNDPVFGAKSNWATGVYDSNGELLSGKEMWCAGCHDRTPSHAEGNNQCGDCHNPHAYEDNRD